MVCARLLSSVSVKKRVLILCTGNSVRSQMAEGLLRHDAGDQFEVESAGTNSSMPERTMMTERKAATSEKSAKRRAQTARRETGSSRMRRRFMRDQVQMRFRAAQSAASSSVTVGAGTGAASIAFTRAAVAG